MHLQWGSESSQVDPDQQHRTNNCNFLPWERSCCWQRSPRFCHRWSADLHGPVRQPSSWLRPALRCVLLGWMAPTDLLWMRQTKDASDARLGASLALNPGWWGPQTHDTSYIKKVRIKTNPFFTQVWWIRNILKWIQMWSRIRNIICDFVHVKAKINKKNSKSIFYHSRQCGGSETFWFGSGSRF